MRARTCGSRERRSTRARCSQRGGNANVDGLWTFGCCGDGYLALYSAKHPQWTTSGPWADKELRIEESGNVFIYQVGSVDEFGSYQAFVDSVCRARIHVDGLDECSYDIPQRRRLELHYDVTMSAMTAVPFPTIAFRGFRTRM